jgi:transcriptional regulator with XRE-family HTH domain
MNLQNDRLSTSEVERAIRDTNAAIDDLFPQTEEAVRDMEIMLGTTEHELPESIADADEVLRRIEDRVRQSSTPSEFGNFLKLLRTKKKVSLEKLANDTDLDPEDIHEIETSHENIASPMTVSVIARYFKLQPKKVQALAGLSRSKEEADCGPSLRIAACADPNFDSLTKEERQAFQDLIKQLK